MPFALYKQTVLDRAWRDVENALTALQAAKDRQAQFVVALDAANNSAILSRSQYRAGLTDITTLNTNESALLSAQNGLSNARADQAQALVRYHLALGGGWDSNAVPRPPTSTFRKHPMADPTSNDLDEFLGVKVAPAWRALCQMGRGRDRRDPAPAAGAELFRGPYHGWLCHRRGAPRLAVGDRFGHGQARADQPGQVGSELSGLVTRWWPM